jgi:hypothetical protein
MTSENAVTDLFHTDDFDSEVEDLLDETESESISIIRAADNLQINLSRPDLGHPEIPDLWEQIHHHGSRSGELVCGKGHPKAVRQYRTGRRWAYHLIKSDCAEHGPGPEHEALAEWVGKRGERDGWNVSLNSWSASHASRPDVHIHGASGINLGVEIQYSRMDDISERSGVARSTKLLRQGYTPMWVAPDFNARNIRERLPSAIFNDLPLHVIKSTDRITIHSGPVKPLLWRHDQDRQQCPRRKGGTCNGWHLGGVRSYGLELGDMVNLAATGQLVVVHRKVRLLDGRATTALQFMTPTDRDAYVEAGGILLPNTLDARPKEAAGTRMQQRSGFTLSCSRPAVEAATTDEERCETASVVAYKPPRVTPGFWTTCRHHDCGATEGVRPYSCGPRCPRHTPAALAGKPEPDELLALRRTAELLHRKWRPTAAVAQTGATALHLHPPGLGGPCARCRATHHRYGPGGQPLCPNCRKDTP